MASLALMKKKIFNQIYFFLFMLLALLLPLQKEWVVYSIGLIFLFWLLEKPWYFVIAGAYLWIIWSTQSVLLFVVGLIILLGLNELVQWLFGFGRHSHFYKLKNEPFRRNILAFSGFYLLYILGLSYSQNLEYASFDLEVKFSMFVFPVLLSTMRKEVFKGKRFNLILVLFVIGCVVSTLVSIGVAVDNYLHSFNEEVFYYRWLSYYHHPGYLSMYLVFAIAILMWFMLKRKEFKLGLWHCIAFCFLIFYFSIIIVMLSSKAGVLSLLMVYMLLVAHIIVYEKKIIQGLVYILLISGMLFLSFRYFSYSLNRIISYKDVVKESMKNDANKPGEEGDRVTLWKNTLEVLKDHIIFGVGTGDVDDKLMEEYKKNKVREAYEKHLNAHNQYLQTFLSLGIAGFLALMLVIILPAFYSLKRRNLLYVIFLLILSINLLVESMFETQAGVVFYAFFNAFLFFSFGLKDQQNQKSFAAKF